MAFPVSPTNGQVTVVNQVSYQYSSATNSWTRILSTANVITANTIAVNGALTVGTTISAVGNITGNYFFGNGSQLTGVAAASAGFPVSAGNSNIAAAANSNIAITVGGTANVAVFATTGEYITGVLSASGTITGGNLATAGTASATGNITGGNILTAGLVSATGTVTGSSFLGAVVSVTSNVTGGNLLTAGLISATGTITGGNLSVVGNVLGNLLPSANITYDLGSATQAWRDLYLSGTSIKLGAQTITSNATAVSVGTANVASGNILTAGLVSATANITGGNLLTGGVISATGNISAGSDISLVGNIVDTGTFWLNTTSNGNINFNPNGTGQTNIPVGILSVTSNVVGGNVLTAGIVSSTGNAIHGNILTAGVVSATANITGGNILTAGLLSATGNIQGNFVLGNGYFLTGVITSVANINNGTSNVNIAAANANVTVSVNGTSNVAVFASTGEYVTGLISASGNITGAGNVSGGNLVSVGLISVAGNAISANVLTSGSVSAAGNLVGAGVSSGSFVSASGNVTGGNVLTAGLVSAAGTITSAANVIGGNLTTAGQVSATSNITGGNVLTAGLISATGNITGGNVNTNQIRNVSGNLTIGVTSGNLILGPSGNVVMSANTYINNVSDPVQNQDVATKAYVDNFATTGIAYHQPVAAATTTTLATTTGGTITYAQPNGVSNGIGATLTTTGSFNLIDTANVQSVGTRILVKNEANAVTNGVYIWSNATVITRSTDTDTYGPDSTTDLSINDYFYTTGGNVNAGTAFIVSAPAGTITFGTSNITFSTFSTSQVYSANTAAGISLNGTVINAKTDGITTAFDGGGNIIVKASANLTTPNIGAATGTSLSATGNVTGGNVLTGGVISATGNITTANAFVAGVTSVGNLGVSTGGNLLATGIISGTGNITGGNIITAGLITATGNASAGNILTGGLVSATANITGGNVLTAGLVSATGNVTGNYILGNGYFLTGVITSVANINNGTSNVNIAAANANVTVSVNGTSNVAVFATTGEYVTGLISASGNITGGNILTAGLISATGAITSVANITGGNILTAGLLSATANVTGGNLLSGGLASVTGNITGGNIVTAGLISATGAITSVANITGGNILTGGLVSATANVTGGNLLSGGLASVTGNITGGNLLSGGLASVTGNITGGNVTATNYYYANGKAVVSYTSATTPPASPNAGWQWYNTTTDVLYEYLYDGTTGYWIDISSPAFAGGVVANVSIAGSMLLNANSVYDLGSTSQQLRNVYATNYYGNGASLTGIITSVGNINNGTSNITVVSSGGNITTSVGGTANIGVWYNGGLSITGDLTVTGNATLTGNIVADRIQNGTTNIDIQSASGNANITIGGTSNTAVFSNTALTLATNLLPSANITYDLGSTTQRWKDLWLSNSTIYLGNSTISANATAIVMTNPAGGQTVLAGASGASQVTGAVVSATGNVTGGNVISGGIISATGNITGSYILGNGSQLTGIDATSIQNGTSNVRVVSSGGNVAVGIGGTSNVFVVATTGIFTTGTSSITGNVISGNVLTGGYISATGNVLGNVFTVNLGNTATAIINGGANGVGNIGSATTYFNTIFGKATTAQYADLAENYLADDVYTPGTVLDFDGEQEVTISTCDSSRRVAGVVSTNPAHLMNSTLDGAHVVAVALVGRVPTQVTGKIAKGDLMVSAGNGRARAEANPAVGTVIGKALENFSGGEGTIEIVICMQ